MEGIPLELSHKIFCLLDYQNLATAQQVCRKWKLLASDNTLWAKLFKERWGEDQAAFYAPTDGKTWKDVYEVQDRCDRIGLGLKIVREGVDYYLICRGEIQRHLGSTKQRKGMCGCGLDAGSRCDGGKEDLEGRGGGSSYGILDKMFFFIGDLEVASLEAKRSRMI